MGGDRIEREIDELLARLGFAEEERPPPVQPVPEPTRDFRRVFPGSPVRFMLICLGLTLAFAVLPAAGFRLLALLAAGAFVVAYLTWLFEPEDTVDPGTPAGPMTRLYHWLYGE